MGLGYKVLEKRERKKQGVGCRVLAAVEAVLLTRHRQKHGVG